MIALLPSDLKEFKEMRTRKVKTPAKYRGKRCGAGNGLFDHESRQGECTSRTPACPEEGYCYLSNWGEWSLCKTKDNAKCLKKMGTRNREEHEIFCCVGKVRWWCKFRSHGQEPAENASSTADLRCIHAHVMSTIWHGDAPKITRWTDISLPAQLLMLYLTPGSGCASRAAATRRRVMTTIRNKATTVAKSSSKRRKSARPSVPRVC